VVPIEDTPEWSGRPDSGSGGGGPGGRGDPV